MKQKLRNLIEVVRSKNGSKKIGLFYNQGFDVLICYQPSATPTCHVIK
ncbi:hypothetical protein [Spiroplasma endosymbiont of Polydrusus cervinus]